MDTDPSIPTSADAGAVPSRNSLEYARNYFEPQLEERGLGKEQIANQTLEELGLSLIKINGAIEHPESFRLPGAGFKIWVIELTTEGIQANLLAILLERKSQILHRTSILRQQGQMSDLIEDVLNGVDDPIRRDSLAESIERQVSKAIIDANAVQVEVQKVNQQREQIEFDVAVQEREVAVQERRSRMRRSWFERESIASIIGALLLLLLGITLIIAMFTGTTAPEIVTSAFLLILGYFFGQATDRRSEQSSKSAKA
jgi:hypothetical protein